MLRISFLWLLRIFLCCLACLPARGGNALEDPGFEDTPPGVDVSPIVGWESYGVNVFSETGASSAHTGNNYLKVYGASNSRDNFTGTYQDIPCAPGAVYTAEAWACSPADDGGGIHGQDQIWVEVTFRDASTNPLALYRSDIVTGGNLGNYGGLSHWFKLPVTNQWSFSYSGGVPTGIAVTNTVAILTAPARTASVRYQIVFHQGPDNANGSAYFDDCLLNPLAWSIVWNDEFDGTTINSDKWVFELGNNNGWGNSELEYYTKRTQNAYASNGLLHIVAQKEDYNGFDYTSARLKTQGRFAKRGGRFEFRAKLPSGVGFWPALWLLGNNFPSVGWPASGEIDVMESKGSTTYQVQGTIHYSDAANVHKQSTLLYFLPNGGSVTNFHTYMVEWLTNRISWYVDGRLYQTRTLWSSSTGPYPAPFNQPFFIVMNLAVGGTYLGSPSPATIDAGTVFPGEMQVDYVRVYDLTPPLEISVSRTNGAVILSWPSNLVCRLQSQTQTDGITGAWTDVASAASPYVVPAQTNAFYRLASP